MKKNFFQENSSSSEALNVIERLQGKGGEIQLQRRGDHYEIIYNGVFLMATYNGASERAVIERALEHIRPPGISGMRVLMGGLGVGYSLQQALRTSRVAAVTLVEIEPAVIRWNNSYLKHINGNVLGDSRVTVLNETFEAVVEREAGSYAGKQAGYHLVMVDTDNGSTWLTRPENADIYSNRGLALIRDCLLPGGVVCIWCAQKEPELEDKLNSLFAGHDYETVLEDTGHEGAFYLARREPV